MSHMEKSRRYTDSPKTPRHSPTSEHKDEDAHWSAAMSPTVGKNHDQEEFTSPTSGKKSVLTKVKEKAKKLRYSLSGKKKHFQEVSISCGDTSPGAGGNSTPSWGVTLEDDKLDDIDYHDDPNEQFEDPEYLGAPMYESEAAPEVCKETAKQHPRDAQLEHVVAEKHVLPDTESMKDGPKQETDKPEPVASNKRETETDEPETTLKAAQIAISPRGSSDYKENLGNVKQSTSAMSPKQWDKGISVKEYLMNAIEPKDDEQALSEAITNAMSPKKNTSGSPGMVEKVKGAVTSFFWHEESSNSTGTQQSVSPTAPALSNKTSSVNNESASPAAPLSNDDSSVNNESTSPAAPSLSDKNPSVNSPTHRPRAQLSELPRSHRTSFRRIAYTPSPSAHEDVEEENHGKILQTN